jgi:hypothetical protein
MGCAVIMGCAATSTGALVPGATVVGGVDILAGTLDADGAGLFAGGVPSGDKFICGGFSPPVGSAIRAGVCAKSSEDVARYASPMANREGRFIVIFSAKMYFSGMCEIER